MDSQEIKVQYYQIWPILVLVLQAQDGRDILCNLHEPSIQISLLMGWRKSEEERSLQNSRSQITRDGENSTRNRGSGEIPTLSSYMQSALCSDCGMSHSDITKIIGLYNQSNSGLGWSTTQKMVSDYLLLHLFPTFAHLPYGPKIIRYKKYTFQQGSLSYQREILFQGGEILFDISYWTLLVVTQ